VLHPRCSQGGGEGGFGHEPEHHSGAPCCSTYCLITDLTHRGEDVTWLMHMRKFSHRNTGGGAYIGGMHCIVDRFGTEYAVARKPWGDGAVIYYVLNGEIQVARALVMTEKPSVSDVLVYRRQDRRRGIGSALYRLIERDLGRPLVPSRIKSAAGKAFWAHRARARPLV
jgi:hypothetical protein